MKKYNLGIVGASGLVGEKILNILKEENLLKNFDLYLITSNKSEGKEIVFDDKKYKYIVLDKKCLELNLDFIIFSAGDEISKDWVEKFVLSGCYVIDNTNAFRKNKSIPLVVPEINGNLINENSKIISNPNCSTIQLAIVADKLKSLSKIEQILVSTYQSVSGAGKLALQDLKEGSHNVFVEDIRNNIIPYIGDFDEKGFCKEENKIIFELNKILNDKIKIAATTVRVPLEYCHGESVYFRFSQKVCKKDIKNVLNCNYIKYFDKICQNNDCYNTNQTCVCRLRKVSDNEYLLFIFADNLRRGAAYNSVLILKNLINKLENLDIYKKTKIKSKKIKK